MAKKFERKNRCVFSQKDNQTTLKDIYTLLKRKDHVQSSLHTVWQISTFLQ